MVLGKINHYVELTPNTTANKYEARCKCGWQENSLERRDALAKSYLHIGEALAE